MDIKSEELNDTIENILFVFGGNDGGVSFMHMKEILENGTEE